MPTIVKIILKSPVLIQLNGLRYFMTVYKQWKECRNDKFLHSRLYIILSWDTIYTYVFKDDTK